MRLTHYTDYAIRVLMYLALLPDEHALATINDIADAYGIPKNHLTKIVHQLAVLGYVDSVRGKNGGIRLACLPTDIRIGSVVRETEPDFDIVACFEDEPKLTCQVMPACSLKRILYDAKQAFLRSLDEVSLADTIADKAHMSQLLQMSVVKIKV